MNTQRIAHLAAALALAGALSACGTEDTEPEETIDDVTSSEAPAEEDGTTDEEAPAEDEAPAEEDGLTDEDTPTEEDEAPTEEVTP